MHRRFFRLPVPEIGYVRAILEGYDGVALLTVPDPNRGEIELAVGEGLEDELTAILSQLIVEAKMIEIPRPADWGSPTSDGSDMVPRR